MAEEIKTDALEGDWIAKARRFARAKVVEASWSDDDIDRLIKQAQQEVDETGEFVHAMAYRGGASNDRTPLMLGIRQVGIDL